MPNTVLINRLFRRIHSSTGSSVVSTIYVPLQFAPLSLGVRCATIPRTVTVRVKFCFLSINAILNLALVGPLLYGGGCTTNGELQLPPPVLIS